MYNTKPTFLQQAIFVNNVYNKNRSEQTLNATNIHDNPGTIFTNNSPQTCTSNNEF